MKILELMILLTLFSVFFFYERNEGENQKRYVHIRSLPEESIVHQKQVKPQREEVHETQSYVLSHEATSLDEMVVYDPELETLWTRELYEILYEIEPHHADKIHTELEAAKKKLEEDHLKILKRNLDELSDLNGESGHGEVLKTARKNPKSIEQRYEKNLREILGDHYEYVKEQEEMFKLSGRSE